VRIPAGSQFKRENKVGSEVGERVYGDIGKDFFHVHHLTQVAKPRKQHTFDPVNDLRPICPNCHAMIHKRREAITIVDLKSLGSRAFSQ
jgi:5-methylcytosine-specific restriction protein A